MQYSHFIHRVRIYNDSMNDLKKAISKEGLIKALCALVSKKTITMEQALEECGLTEEVFVEKMKEYGLDK